VKKLLSILLLALPACGGGGGADTGSANSPSSGSPPPTMDQSIGGIWTAKFTQSLGNFQLDPFTARAIATEDGDFYVFALNVAGCADLSFGKANVTGSTVTATLIWGLIDWTDVNGTPPNCVQSDGSTSGTGSITGTVAQQSSLTLTEADITAKGFGLGSETATWTYDPLYSQPSSLATIAGNYTDSGRTLTIDLNGVLTEQEGNGCVLNGQVSVPNPSFNAYTFSLTYTGCSAPVDGIPVTGVGTLDTTQSPNILVFGVQFTVAGVVSVTAYELPKQ
jgi:hypothetical protein